MNIKWDKVGLFVGGMLFATKGVQALTSKTAHDIYVKTTALALRGRDEVMDTVTSVREGCEDIYAEAADLNEEKDLEAAEAEAMAVIEDLSEETCEIAEESAEAVEEAAKEPAKRAKKAEDK